ncbi:MAG: TauD/TfdA family dioxygenase, partial [Halobacteriovoraceae bacterium]|nr:TauD/TfdA family dioxygenase [Halobacteriovoraceae bacterium]
SKNYLFTKEKVPFHWDGAFHEVPSILAFHCLEETTGGRTLFADTTKVIMNLKESEIALLEEHSIEYETEKLAHYGGHISQKVIAKHPFTLKKILRLGEEVYTEFNPVKRIIKSENLKNIVLKLEVDLYKPSYCYAHEWKKGDLLLVDNYSLLHGREPFTNFEKKRHIRRIQIR